MPPTMGASRLGAACPGEGTPGCTATAHNTTQGGPCSLLCSFTLLLQPSVLAAGYQNSESRVPEWWDHSWQLNTLPQCQTFMMKLPLLSRAHMRGSSATWLLPTASPPLSWITACLAAFTLAAMATSMSSVTDKELSCLRAFALAENLAVFLDSHFSSLRHNLLLF